MTNAAPNQPNAVFLLPKLKADVDVKLPSRSATWDIQHAKAFVDVANSLDYQTLGEVKSVSAVPTIWSRPLTVEMALSNSKHPLHAQTVQQWRGMLAAIALAEVRGFPLKAELLDLKTFKDSRGNFQEYFAESLYKLLPDYQNTALYRLDGGGNPWEEVYLFLWDDRPVGMTSPSTIVMATEQGEWNGLPWWNTSTGVAKLEAPNDKLDRSEQILLQGWLKNLSSELRNHQGNRDAVNRIQGLLADFMGTLAQDPQVEVKFSDNPAFFGTQISRGVLVSLNKPVKSNEQRESNVQLMASGLKPGVKPLLILDDTLPSTWGVQSQNVAIHRGKTFATPNLKANLRSGVELWDDVVWLEPQDLFLSELSFLEQESAFPGGLPLNLDGAPLSYNGKRITPLLPINSILLDYFSPEDLNKAIRVKQENLPSGPGVRVYLNLRLTGISVNGSKKEDLVLFKDYPLVDKQGLADIPVVEVWPNFATPNWKTYYGFYFDGEYGNTTFQAVFPGTIEQQPFAEGSGQYNMCRMEKFPTHIECQNLNRTAIGLVLLKTPSLIQPGKAWKVGVDFGTSFTNIYVNGSQSGNSSIQPLQLKNLHLKVTNSDLETRLPTLFQYFLPEYFVPPEKPLPLSTVLINLGSASGVTTERPMFDGRFLIPNSSKGFDPSVDWIKTNLKWSIDNLKYNRIFLKHLMLYISAIAASEQVQSITWSLSYPSAFSNSDLLRYAQVWKQMAEEIGKNTGIVHNVPKMEEDDRFRTESLTVAQFFADFNGSPEQDLIHTTCLDVGGGTSDISIWQDNTLVHQCSVQFAGRDLFSKFLIDDGMKFLKNHLLDEGEKGSWQNLQDYGFNAKLDVWLRLQADSWLRDHRAFVEPIPKFKGFIRLVTIGYAGLFYYIGLVLKTLHDEGKLSRDEITPVCLGGNGSRFLNWLVVGGEFSSGSDVRYLLSRMMTQGSWFKCDEAFTRSQADLNSQYHHFDTEDRGFRDIEANIFLSPNPKDEVAFGLVLNDTKLKGLGRKEKDPLIAGERFKINGEEKGQGTRFEKSQMKQLEMPVMPELQRFLYAFHIALQDLEVDEIKPLPESLYKPSLRAGENEAFWRNTKRRLDNMMLKMKQQNDDDIRLEPPFILGLKALLQVLSEEWIKS